MARKSRTERDAGLRQVSTATKWIAGLAAVLTGFITVWEARNVHHAGASTPTVVQQPASSGAADPGSSYSDPGYSDGGVQPPVSAPVPSDQSSSASSGGS
jgi:hypothetical protein